MKITGFITEYNPFHNGHLYHMEQAKQLTGADYTVALMSGSHVQRGEPAVFDKYTRTKMALSAGVDLVLELPAAFSTASAMEFASYGISLFTALGAVDSVVFGSECGSLAPLQAAAKLLSEEAPEFRAALQQYIKSGMTYPQARAAALSQTAAPKNTAGLEQTVMPESAAALDRQELEALLSSPNNILGIEYLRAAQRLKSHLSFYTVRREGSHYHENCILADSNFPSASALRQELKKEAALSAGSSTIQTAKSFSGLIPDSCLSILKDEIPVFADDYSLLLQDQILRLQAIKNEEMPDIADFSPELLAHLKKSGPWPASYTKRVQNLKSRQFTYTRISRALLHLLLDIHTRDIEQWKAEGYAPYARILGFRRESAPLLKELKKRSSIPFINKTADAPKCISASALRMLEQEIRVSHLYQSVKAQKGGQFRNEYTEGVILL